MEALKEKLKDNVLIEATTGCWLWQLSTNAKGYGQLRYKGTTRKVHRLAYTAFNGEIPKGNIVRHTCDTPQCCNPKHLLVGTVQDNTNDMYSRGREPCRKGANNPKSKLTWDTVRAIRSSTESRRVLADTYNVHITHIGLILNNKCWVE